MDSKTLIYSKRALLDATTVYIHFIKSHLSSKQIKTELKKLYPIRNDIKSSIQKDSNIVLDRFQTAELLVCLIASEKITKDKKSKAILSKSIKGIEECFIKSSEFPNEAKKDINRLENKLKL